MTEKEAQVLCPEPSPTEKGVWLERIHGMWMYACEDVQGNWYMGLSNTTVRFYEFGIAQAFQNTIQKNGGHRHND